MMPYHNHIGYIWNGVYSIALKELLTLQERSFAIPQFMFLIRLCLATFVTRKKLLEKAVRLPDHEADSIGLWITSSTRRVTRLIHQCNLPMVRNIGRFILVWVKAYQAFPVFF